MRRSAMIAGHPWTMMIVLEEEPDSLGCWVKVQEMTIDGGTADYWERYYERSADAMRDIEMAYGIGRDDWTELD